MLVGCGLLIVQLLFRLQLGCTDGEHCGMGVNILNGGLIVDCQFEYLMELSQVPPEWAIAGHRPLRVFPL